MLSFLFTFCGKNYEYQLSPKLKLSFDLSIMKYISAISFPSDSLIFTATFAVN